MKFCSHCGKEIMDEAVICPGCGCAVAGNQISQNEPQTEVYESKSTANCALLFAFFLPLLGIIFGIIGACKYKDSSLKSKSIISIVVSIVMWIVWAAIFINLQ